LRHWHKLLIIWSAAGDRSQLFATCVQEVALWL
jgi:hypothetical protein